MKRAFTLIEVLLALTLMGLFFGLLSYSFYSSLRSSYLLSQSSQLTKEEILLFWDLQRKLIGATDLYLKKDAIFMTTTSGDYYQGIVKCAYVYKDGWLYYYSYPLTRLYSSFLYPLLCSPSPPSLSLQFE